VRYTFYAFFEKVYLKKSLCRSNKYTLYTDYAFSTVNLYVF
jgi:hypothetical protein